MNCKENNFEEDNFEVSPKKVITHLSILSFCGMVTAMLFYEFFDKRLVFISLVLLIILIVMLIVKNKEPKLYMKNNLLYYKDIICSSENIRFIKLTYWGNIYIYCGEKTIKIHKSYNGVNNLLNWAENRGIAISGR